MPDIQTWGWYSPSPWPGYDPANQSNLDARGDGLSVDPAGYLEFTMRDADGDGRLWDHDSDDVHSPTPGEYVIGPTTTLNPQEIALYAGSTAVIGGVTYTGLDIEVTLFDDGTWGARLMDHSIPPGTHHDYVTSVTLGTWNGVEYDGIWTSGVDQPFVCFTAGTRIAVPGGTRAVEDLCPGDAVMTLDHGQQPVRWVAQRRIGPGGRGAPLQIASGLLGNGRAVHLSPQHRVLLGGHRILRRFSTPEVLVAVTHLQREGEVSRIRASCTRYVHLLLDRHEIVLADGLLTETLLPGPQALAMLPERDRWQLVARLPALSDGPEGVPAPGAPLSQRQAGAPACPPPASEPRPAAPRSGASSLRERLACAGARTAGGLTALRPGW
ncbi:Hint domain-containing protein [Salipiger mucosus]|uniref:Hedgehog/Intein (Hint) domain-containing protein n=1 Tax=Salipiger mucosus DSM 16094 TaxID=1123237 RepID=S9RDS5_9RHOB|nr:Hint domain-containing protein [Salipiger mucosus]EPX76280.1 hypothetical protein Salmuc_01266 [Salipiger mucosus DSM 16094]